MYANLKFQLFKAGIRQNQFARMLNIHETVLSKIVNGFREPEPELCAKIAQLLGREERWLFAITSAPAYGTLEAQQDEDAL